MAWVGYHFLHDIRFLMDGEGVREMEGTHQIKINTKAGIFELNGVSIMDQTIDCTIRYRGNAPSVVELTLLADIDLEDRLTVQAKSIGEQSQK